jgi:hypothetical protein
MPKVFTPGERQQADMSVRCRTRQKKIEALSCGLAEQLLELLPYGAVALTGSFLEAGAVENIDAAVLVVDHACLLQNAGSD